MKLNLEFTDLKIEDKLLLIDTRPIANTRENVRGEIKLSVQYHRGALTVMVNTL